MIARTWPYGTQLRGTVIEPTIKGVQLVVDEHGEGHALCGGADDPNASTGDTGVLTFMKGGPTGGYWQFRRVVIRKWSTGDRVTREIYMDDGTWQRRGDKCLPKSPLRHGVVIRRDSTRPDGVWVRWDDGTERMYLDHGIDAEK